MILSIEHWELLTPFGGRDCLAVSGAPQSAGCRSIEQFDKDAALGRKGTRNFDRQTALFVRATASVLEQAELEAERRGQLGVVLGTAAGSVSSSLEFLAESIRCDKPYDVNPGHFPNTVINCAAGQAAIWHRLRGPNVTLSAGAQSFFVSLQFAARWCASHTTPGMLVGAVEEVTPLIEALHSAHVLSAPEAAHRTLVEACGAFLISAGCHSADQVLATQVLAQHPADRSPSQTLAECIKRCLRRTDVSLEEVAFAVSRREKHEWSALDALGYAGERLSVESMIGDAYSASGAIALGVALQLLPRDLNPVVLLTSASSNGSVACSIVRLNSRPPETT